MTKRYDKTQSTRQSRRRAALNALAQVHGYDSWSKLETAVLNDSVTLTVTPQPAAHDLAPSTVPDNRA